MSSDPYIRTTHPALEIYTLPRDLFSTIIAALFFLLSLGFVVAVLCAALVVGNVAALEGLAIVALMLLPTALFGWKASDAARGTFLRIAPHSVSLQRETWRGPPCQTWSADLTAIEEASLGHFIDFSRHKGHGNILFIAIKVRGCTQRVHYRVPTVTAQRAVDAILHTADQVRSRPTA